MSVPKNFHPEVFDFNMDQQTVWGGRSKHISSFSIVQLDILNCELFLISLISNQPLSIFSASRILLLPPHVTVHPHYWERYGFVRFASIEAANAAIESKNGLHIGTKCIKVRRIGSIRGNISGPRPFSNDLGAVHAKGHSNMQ